MKSCWKRSCLAALLSCGALLTLSGCASIISGQSQSVTIKSEPDGATVLIGGQEMGKTPLTLQLKRKTGQMATIRKEGYRPQNFPLSTDMNPWFLGNFLLGGVLGSTTDSASGAINEYTPNFYDILLYPDRYTSVGSPAAEVKSYIVANYRNILEELKSSPGPYLGGLLSLLRVAPERQLEAIKAVRTLSQEYTDIVDFASKVYVTVL